MPQQPDPCWLPGDLERRVAAVAEDAAVRAQTVAERFEFTTYNCGSRAPHAHDVEPAHADAFRWALRIALRERLAVAWPRRRYDPERPEMVIAVAPRGESGWVEFEPMPAFVAGRYRKLARGLSQTVFHCHRCRGRRGRRQRCTECGGSGRAVAQAVEDFVRPAIQAALDGRASAFHGAGREDVDVRMLGDGRPFVVSIDRPRLRSLDASVVAAKIRDVSSGQVEVAELVPVSRAIMKRITMAHGEKSYRVVVRPAAQDGVLPADAPERVAALSGVTLEQRTPARVEARRADRVRRRIVRELSIDQASPVELVLRLRTDPGLYVKEFISGDEGRTSPCVSDALGTPCVCAELDVIGVGGAPDESV